MQMFEKLEPPGLTKRWRKQRLFKAALSAFNLNHLSNLSLLSQNCLSAGTLLSQVLQMLPAFQSRIWILASLAFMKTRNCTVKDFQTICGFFAQIFSAGKL